MRFALVGNGSVSWRDARLIDRHDFVVRFNKAKQFGLTGWRTDVLAIANTDALTHSNSDRRPLMAARELWLRCPSLVELVPGRMIRLVQDQDLRAELKRLGAQEGTMPSTGVAVINYILHEFPSAGISLFGFTHAGNGPHDWKAEQAYCDKLAAEGRLVKFDTKDGALTAMFMSCRRFVHRVARHLVRAPDGPVGAEASQLPG